MVVVIVLVLGCDSANLVGRVAQVCCIGSRFVTKTLPVCENCSKKISGCLFLL